MTPCEEKGYKVGDRFEVVDEKPGGICYAGKGDVIELAKDDNSDRPLFVPVKTRLSWGRQWVFLDCVKKVGE